MSGRHAATPASGSSADPGRPAASRPADAGVPVLEVTGAGLTYPTAGLEVVALADVDLRVEPGELVCLAGPSGSGKSTLCHLVAGFEVPTTGTVRVRGSDPRAVRDWSVLACVPQRLALLPELTVAETVDLPRRFARGSGVEDLDGMMDALGLGALGHRLVGETSIGEQQRTAIARGMAARPALLVLDEPTGHQDDEHVDVVLAALRSSARRGTATLVSTHDERVLAVADRVVRLDQGRVVEATDGRTPAVAG